MQSLFSLEMFTSRYGDDHHRFRSEDRAKWSLLYKYNIILILITPTTTYVLCALIYMTKQFYMKLILS